MRNRLGDFAEANLPVYRQGPTTIADGIFILKRSGGALAWSQMDIVVRPSIASAREVKRHDTRSVAGRTPEPGPGFG